MNHNPFLDLSALPNFSDFKAADIQPAVEHTLKTQRQTIETVIAAGVFTWAGLVEPLERLTNDLDRMWSPIKHLNSVADTAEWRKAYNQCLSLLTEYYTDMGQNQALYQAYHTLADSPEFATLNTAQQRCIDNELRSFHLSGIGLATAQQAEYKAIKKRLSSLTSQFSQNLLDASHAWFLHLTDETQLTGLPDDAKLLARQTAEQRDLAEGWVLTLDIPCYLAVMQYADDAKIRQTLYTAFSTRAADFNPDQAQWDNTPLINELLDLRLKMAQLLGYAHYADMSLATKMAKDSQQVLDFLYDLAQRSKPLAAAEFTALSAFAAEQGIQDLEAWDVAYYSEKLRLQRYDLSAETLRPYFALPAVLKGLFEIVNRLYGLNIQARDDVDVWHKDVRFFDIFDADNQLRGQFYLDPYARDGKRGGAWMDSYSGRFQFENHVQTPVAYLTCNFMPPVADKPALLTHREVETLFHEFGHGLQHMLTQIDVYSVSGINGVLWDAVELPSQLMENWCWEREALDLFARHYASAAPLDEALFNKMQAAKNFQSGMQMIRQLEFALFDFQLYCDQTPNKTAATVQAILDTVRTEVGVVPVPEFNRFQNGFQHIFAGGYAAGYYSYKWAEVLSADVFSEFENKGIFDRETGRKFMQSVLEQGGAKAPIDLFIEFRGREPKIDALLRHSGMNN